MSTNFQQAPYLRNQRDFPDDNLKNLSVQSDLSYIDIAQKVNARTIGIFALNIAMINGERWFLQGSSQSQQALREVYIFKGTGTIPHGINFNSVSQFSKPSGSFTDGNKYYGCIYASDTPIAGQVSFYIDSTNIVILSGIDAPSITSGLIILEWISAF